MEIITGIVVFLKLLMAFLQLKAEKDAEVKKQKEDLFKEMQDANKANDMAKFAASFDVLNRL